MNEQSDKHDDKKPHELPIQIDGKQYKVEQEEMTGADLRQLAQIGADRDLFQEVPGGEDKLIADDEKVGLKPGMHFFSVQRNINPGG